MIAEIGAGLADLRQGLRRLNIALLLAMDGLRRSHRRTELGILWLIVPQAVMVSAFIWVFTQVFSQQVEGFPLYIGTGILAWSLIVGILTGAPSAILSNARWILSQPIPISTLLFSFLMQSSIQFGFLLPIYVGLLIFYLPPIGIQMLLFLPGLVVVLATGLGVSLIFGPLGARFRDLGPAMGILATVAFLMTPVIWPASAVGRRVFFIHGNPFYHLLEVVRQPLMGQAPSAENWTYACVVAVVVLGIGLLSFGWLKRQVFYWIS